MRNIQTTDPYRRVTTMIDESWSLKIAIVCLLWAVVFVALDLRSSAAVANGDNVSHVSFARPSVVIGRGE